MDDQLKGIAPTKAFDSIEAVIPGLYASAPQPLPFAPSLDIRAFLLHRQQGNLLVYSVTELEFNSSVVQDLRGIARQYLNHCANSSLKCIKV